MAKLHGASTHINTPHAHRHTPTHTHTPSPAHTLPCYQYVSHLFSFYDCVTRSTSTNPKATKATAHRGVGGSGRGSVCSIHCADVDQWQQQQQQRHRYPRANPNMPNSCREHQISSGSLRRENGERQRGRAAWLGLQPAGVLIDSIIYE